MKDLMIKKILTSHVYGAAKETPLDLLSGLSKRFHNNIYLKREDLQDVFSFKIRGAFNCMYQLSDKEKKNGVIASSAGNHGQGIAMAGKQLEIDTTIVMPCITPDIKVEAVKSLGGNVVIFGNNYDEAYSHALSMAKDKMLTFIHPFDNIDVIAGQGTIGMELLRQHSDFIDAIFIPVGGGGLLSGIGTYVKYLSPNTKIIGVEHEEAPSMYQSIKNNCRVVLNDVGGFADGVAVKQIGENTFNIVKNVIDDILLVSTDETCAAIKDMFDDTRTVLEPAGAISIAGMKKYIQTERIREGNLVAVTSGSNINFNRLRYVSERAEISECRELLIACIITEEPGSFKNFCKCIGNRPITEFNYRYSDPNDACIFVGINLSNGIEEKNILIKSLNKSGYVITDLSDNEVAKDHLRYMVGGRPPKIENESLYRFYFPEKPGALLNFLNHLGDDWNISLFHYRNHGSDFGRVLIGMQIPSEEKDRFLVFLDEIGYTWVDESKNEAYKLFLM